MADTTDHIVDNLEKAAGVSIQIYANESEDKDGATAAEARSDGEKSFDEIKKFLESGSGLDIYQLVAFRLKTGAGCYEEIDDKHRSLTGYYGDIGQCIVATLTQLISLMIIAYESSKDGDKDWCNGLNNRLDGNNDVTDVVVTKIMAGCYTLLLSSIFWSRIQVQTNGFYRLIDYRLKSYEWIDSRVLDFGNYWNFIVSIATIIESFLIIFYSTSGLNVILNSVALFFIPDIDNMVVTESDYLKCLEWFKNVEKGKNEKIKSIQQCMSGKKHQKTKKFLCLYLIFNIIIKLSGTVAVIGAPLLAIATGVCY